jgi:hypothetical protein
MIVTFAYCIIFISVIQCNHTKRKRAFIMTALNRWYDMTNEGDTYPTYTHDTWVIPEDGTEIWCTGWKRGQTIKPYGDGCHVLVGYSTYHCDQLMDILQNWERDGEKWGIEGIKMTREQQISGRWTPVKVA